MGERKDDYGRHKEEGRLNERREVNGRRSREKGGKKEDQGESVGENLKYV